MATYTSQLGPKISTEVLNEAGFEGKKAEVIQILADGSQLTRTDLQKRVNLTAAGLALNLKDLAKQGIIVETVHYDGPEGKRQSRFSLDPKSLVKLLNRRADALRKASLEIEKIYSSDPDDREPQPRPAPPPPVAPPATPPRAVPAPVAAASPNGAGARPSSPFRQRG